MNINLYGCSNLVQCDGSARSAFWQYNYAACRRSPLKRVVYTEEHQQISAGLYTRQKVPGDRETTKIGEKQFVSIHSIFKWNLKTEVTAPHPFAWRRVEGIESLGRNPPSDSHDPDNARVSVDFKTCIRIKLENLTLGPLHCSTLSRKNNTDSTGFRAQALVRYDPYSLKDLEAYGYVSSGDTKHSHELRYEELGSAAFALRNPVGGYLNYRQEPSTVL
ncbi:hypothetical protein EDD85DRAFT_939785 [Armillaria nabsnona]|nr:hypothetical protein EDD85DRAFT_939785 [Armillaria nabsnona]